MNEDPILIHDIITTIQESLDIAKKVASQKYAFSISEMEVKATFNFTIKKEDKDIPVPEKHRGLLSLFTRKKNPHKTPDESEEDSGSITLRMLFKPGGKLLPGNKVVDGTSGQSPDSSTKADNKIEGKPI